MAEAPTSSVVSLTDRERVSKLYNRHMSMLQTTSTPCCSEASTLSGSEVVCGHLMKWANHDEYLDPFGVFEVVKIK